MRVVVGLIMILVGIALGIYLGFWVMFVGGIVGIVEIVQSGSVTAGAIAAQALRILFAGAVGGLAFKALALPDIALIAGR